MFSNALAVGGLHHCLDHHQRLLTISLLCRKPTRQQIAKRMMQICMKEGLQVNESTLEALVEGANADIRLILGQLQMIRLSSKRLSYDDVKVHLCSCHETCCFAEGNCCLVLLFICSGVLGSYQV